MKVIFSSFRRMLHDSLTRSKPKSTRLYRPGLECLEDRLTPASLTSLYNTGVDDFGNVLANGAVDPHYSITVAPSPLTPGAANVVLQNGFPFDGHWLSDGDLSKWIAPHANQNDFNAGVSEPPGDYTYQTTFDLTGFDPQTACIAGQLSADNTLVQVRLNGVDAGVPAGTSTDFFAFHSFMIGAGFQEGVNTLEFVVRNLPQVDHPDNLHNPSGLRVELTGTANRINHRPVLEVIENQEVRVGQALTFTATAFDPDGDHLRYSLVGAPAAMRINPETGVATWTPSKGDIGSHVFTVSVVDDGAPALLDSQTLRVVVLADKRKLPSLLGPSVVPSRSEYEYKLLPGDFSPKDIKWSLHSTSKAQIVGPDNNASVRVRFPDVPDVANLLVEYSIGSFRYQEFFEDGIAVVKVTIGEPTPKTSNATRDENINNPFLVDDLSKPVVSRHSPGSDFAAFRKTKRSPGPLESGIRVLSGAGAEPAFSISTDVQLVAPKGHENAVSQIMVGLIQTVRVTSGTANYEEGKVRKWTNGADPSVEPLDWLSPKGQEGKKSKDEWPWYQGGDNQRWRSFSPGEGSRHTYSMSDSPELDLPLRWNPKNGGMQRIVSAKVREEFVVNVAAITLDGANNASQFYWSQSYIGWSVDWVYEKGRGGASVSSGKKWVDPAVGPNGSPKLIDVDVVPGVIYRSNPFATWEPQ